ncbi:hypothetical protein SEA_MARKY_62 [Streptomyces phage Marky]|nr:hypothetical protein SEA_MARKY_62 [Streptomyces phage Marky]
MQNWQTELHRNERYPFNLAGKPYIWVRVNGQLRAVSALAPGGGLTAAALDRIADGK